MRDEHIHIRCPIHGTLPVTHREIKLIDHPSFQRLRNIKQLGFADLSFPGATHTRYSHSLGAMHIATRLFDRLFPSSSERREGRLQDLPDLPERVRARFRQTVRLAMLFHDLGHAPLSHTTELLMPAVGELGLGSFAGDDVTRRASHEDYTLKIVLDSSLGQLIENHFHEADGIVAKDVAELIVGATWQEASTRFRHGGIDYTPALRQIVSSECDADRMDYLQRDSFYSGVNYGKFDADWLIDNVVAVVVDGQIFMGIRSRAIFSFEDFLLSRYHMFATVYLHYTPVIFEKMLSRYFETCKLAGHNEFFLPADIEKYTALDDMDLLLTLRKSKNPWARRIIDRRPFVLLDEQNVGHQRPRAHNVSHDVLVARLGEAKIEHIATRSRTVLSKYFGDANKKPIYVVDGEHVIPLEEFTPLYSRYQKPSQMNRVFVDPERRSEARQVMQRLVEDGGGGDAPN